VRVNHFIHTMNTATAPSFTPETKLGDIVVARPSLARVFERLGLDYCCGGQQTLTAACARKGLDPHTVIEMLVAAEAESAAPVEADAAGMTLSQLADHIEQTHHVYVKAELPRLVEMAGRVAGKHGWRDVRLAEVHQTVIALAEEMFSHMRKEELILFPIVRQIEVGAADGSFHCGSIANPISVMEAEHESAGNAVARLRELTDGFAPDAESCNTHRALLAGLADFEADLHRHVHKENNILFPRTLARAGRN
jgi:regulator of cell morphogenesis and NO signaling